MLFDAHIHFGQFEETYYTPPRILRTLSNVGITHFAYSSTSAVVTDDPVFMQEERHAMKELSKGRAVPLLWVTHSMLRKSKDLALYLDEEIRGLKIHGISESWTTKELYRALSIAREQGLAVKFHTGEFPQCYAGAYASLCKKFSDVKIILAHGRPLDQTIQVLEQCPNAFVDTAFMPHEHLQKLLDKGFSRRILFGTDTPIPGRFLKSSLTRYLQRRIATSKKIAGIYWADISSKNAQILFGGF